MKIRKFRKDDRFKAHRCIRKALYEVNSKDYPNCSLDMVNSKYTPNRLIDFAKKQEFFVAVEGEKLLGTIALDLDKNVIYCLFVNPAVHKKGIGRSLMEFAEDRFRNMGVKSLRVPSSLTAHGFYRILGYKKVKDFFVKGKKDGIIMEKRL